MVDVAGTPQTARSELIVMESCLEFSSMQASRTTHAEEWNEIAASIDPPSRDTFQVGNWNTPGEKKTEKQIDATAMLAKERFTAILDSLLTPRNMTWHGMGPSNADLAKDRDVKLYFEQVTRRLFQARYSPIANFSSQNQANYDGLGCYGNGGMFIDQAVNANNVKLNALRYKALPMGEMYLRQNHQGLVDGFIRYFKLTAEQCFKQFGFIPDNMKAAAERKSDFPFQFIHRVCPRADYDPERLDYMGKPFASYYISLDAKVLMSEGGYNSFPLAVGRYKVAPGEVYGRGPASFVLPAVKTLNAEKKTFLKQGHRAADPVLLTADDGLLDAVSLRPGAMNKGGVTADGKELVKVLPTGSIQTTIEMMNEERTLINDAFLITLFQILTESPGMTATEVIERTNEKGILLAPTVGGLQSGYLGPLIEREVDLMAELGMLPPMPGILREAAGEYEVVYTSPISKHMRAQEAAGFYRTLENVTQMVNITGDTSPLDNFDFDVIVPELSDIQGVPASWMADPKKIAATRQARAQQAQTQQEIQAAPAAAAMMKAQAMVAKGNPGQGAQ